MHRLTRWSMDRVTESHRLNSSIPTLGLKGEFFRSSYTHDPVQNRSCTTHTSNTLMQRIFLYKNNISIEQLYCPFLTRFCNSPCQKNHWNVGSVTKSSYEGICTTLLQEYYWWLAVATVLLCLGPEDRYSHWGACTGCQSCHVSCAQMHGVMDIRHQQ